MNIDKLLSTKRSRVIFIVSAIVAAGTLFVIRTIVIPVVSGTPLPNMANIMGDVVGNLFSMVIASTATTLLLWYVFPPENIRYGVEVVEPFITNELHEKALMETDFWFHDGHFGKWTRIVAMPTLSELSTLTNKNKEISLAIMNPENDLLMREYSRYRNGVRSSKKEGKWTSERVQQELYATIIVAHFYSQTQPFLNISIYLNDTFSLFRRDICSSFVILTKEDPREPALAFYRDSLFFSSSKEDFYLLRRRLRCVSLLDSLSIDLTNLSHQIIIELFQKLNINIPTAPNFLDEVVKLAKEGKNPYE